MFCRDRSLQRTLAELRDYQQKHDSWKQQQQKLVSEQASRSEKIEQTVSYETYKLQLANEGVGALLPLFIAVGVIISESIEVNLYSTS